MILTMMPMGDMGSCKVEMFSNSGEYPMSIIS